MKTKHAAARKTKKKKVLKQAKGYRGKRSKVLRRAKESVRRALAYSYRDRKQKKRTYRGLWIVRINAAVRGRGLSYREFIHRLKENDILLSRDMLAYLASEKPEAFDALVEEVKQK